MESHNSHFKIGEKALSELKERFGDDKVHFVECNVLKTEDINKLYEVKLYFTSRKCIL